MQQHREFFAAESAKQITVAELRLDPAREIPQHLIPGVMTERIVNLLEMIHIHQQKRKGCMFFGRSGNHGPGPQHKRSAVQDAGKLIIGRSPFQLRISTFP
ncbi:hypothetical protein D3C73_788200 [compost metagenome]